MTDVTVLLPRIESVVTSVFNDLNSKKDYCVQLVNNDTALPSGGLSLYNFSTMRMTYEDLYTLTIPALDLIPYEVMTDNTYLKQGLVESKVLGNFTVGIKVLYKKGKYFTLVVDSVNLAKTLDDLHDSFLTQAVFIKNNKE